MSSVKMKMLVAQSRPALCDLMDCNPPGKNTVVGNHLLLYGLLPTKRLSVGLLHCKQISEPPRKASGEWVLVIVLITKINLFPCQ